MNLITKRESKDHNNKNRNPSDSFNKDQPNFVTIRISYQVSQSVGMQRTHNEDALFASCQTYQNSDSPMSIGIFMVADGMGGHADGELASALAIKNARKCLAEEIDSLLINFEEKKDIHDILQKAIYLAQESVVNKVPDGGTTLTAACVINHQITFAHVGDSRLYLITMDGNMTQLTQDHSLVKRLVELGQISPTEALSHPHKNVLFRALGQTEAFKVDIDTFEVHEPCLLLLCSDGLWGQVPDSQMIEIISRHNFNLDACDELVNYANQMGGPDNISVILAKIENGGS